MCASAMACGTAIDQSPPRLRERRRPAALAAPLGFRTSQLRGVGLARRGAGAAHTARWVSMEAHPSCVASSPEFLIKISKHALQIVQL